MAGCQRWKCDKKSALSSKIMHFQLLQAAISKPVELGKSYISLLKAQINIDLNNKRKNGYSSMFNIRQANFKSAHLLHKMAK